jgi:hypothetical protein
MGLNHEWRRIATSIGNQLMLNKEMQVSDDIDILSKEPLKRYP